MELPSVQRSLRLQVNGEVHEIPANKPFVLTAGERITMIQGVLHAFWPDTEYALIGEVSTANDDRQDNFFEDKRVGRFNRIVEDEPAVAKLISDGDSYGRA